MTNKRSDLVSFVSKNWWIIAAISAGSVAWGSLITNVNANSRDISEMKPKCESITEIKTDIKWIREALEKR